MLKRIIQSLTEPAKSSPQSLGYDINITLNYTSTKTGMNRNHPASTS